MRGREKQSLEKAWQLWAVTTAAYLISLQTEHPDRINNKRLSRQETIRVSSSGRKLENFTRSQKAAHPRHHAPVSPTFTAGSGRLLHGVKEVWQSVGNRPTFMLYYENADTFISLSGGAQWENHRAPHYPARSENTQLWLPGMLQDEFTENDGRSQKKAALNKYIMRIMIAHYLVLYCSTTLKVTPKGHISPLFSKSKELILAALLTASWVALLKLNYCSQLLFAQGTATYRLLWNRSKNVERFSPMPWIAEVIPYSWWISKSLS